MSVRRLAEDTVQPAKFAFKPAMAREAKKWIAKYPKGRQASAVIPLLMLAQDQDGWVTRAAIENVAEMLEMPYIRVLEVATFYTQFQLAPVGTRAHVQICGTTPCMLRGSEELISLCKRRIHPEPFHTNATGTLSWEEVECQGACVNAPMVMIFSDTYEDLTPQRLEEIIDAFEAGKGAKIKPGPQIDRIYSAPEGGLTTLLEAFTPKKRKSGESSGPTLKLGKTASEMKPRSKAKEPVTSGNPTIKLAATAAGRAKPSTRTSGKTAATSADANRPAAIKKPAAPDDLKLISGVGPKLEGVLNGLGIYTYGQIAQWKKAEREWVDTYLNFKGRIERDDWVRQAKALAKGGRDEYVRVFGKEPR